MSFLDLVISGRSGTSGTKACVDEAPWRNGSDGYPVGMGASHRTARFGRVFLSGSGRRLGESEGP